MNSNFLSKGLCILIAVGAVQSVTANLLVSPTQLHRLKPTWDYDGSRILGHIGFDLYLWDADTGRLIKRMVGHKERLFSVQFSPEGNLALSSSWLRPNELLIESKDTSIRLWDISKQDQTAIGQGFSEFDSGKELLRLNGFIAGGFDWTGKKIVAFEDRKSSDKRYNLAVFNSESGKKLHSVQLEEGCSPSNCRLDFTRKGDIVISAGQTYTHSFELKSGLVMSIDKGYAQSSVLLSESLFARFRSDKIDLLDIRSGKVNQSVPLPEEGSWEVGWSTSGNKVAGARPKGKVYILNLTSGKLVSEFECGRRPKTPVFSPDGSLVLVEWGGVSDETGLIAPEIGVYDVHSGQELHRIKLADWGHLIGFSPNGKTFLVGGQEFIVYESKSGNVLRRLRLLKEVDSHDW